MSGTISCDSLTVRSSSNFDVFSRSTSGAGSNAVWIAHPGQSSITLTGTGVWLVTGFWSCGAAASAMYLFFCITNSATKPNQSARIGTLPLDSTILYYTGVAYSSGGAYDTIPISHTITAAGTYYFYVGGYTNGCAYRLTLTKIA